MWIIVCVCVFIHNHLFIIYLYTLNLSSLISSNRSLQIHLKKAIFICHMVESFIFFKLTWDGFNRREKKKI